MVFDNNDCRTGSVNGIFYECEQIIKYLGNGEANDTGDPDGDGFMGEDWYNGYDDDGDCPGATNNDGIICGPGDDRVYEDYFFSDGIDNGGDIICEGDSNGDGALNVLDVVLLVNLVLGQAYETCADMNNDATLNVLDVVTLVNAVLTP